MNIKYSAMSAVSGSIVATVLAGCGQAQGGEETPPPAQQIIETKSVYEPGFDEIFGLIIETERHLVQIESAAEGVVMLKTAEEYLEDDVNLERVDQALRGGVAKLITLRDELCRTGLHQDVSCVSIDLPDWFSAPPNVPATSYEAYKARSLWLTETMQPFISLGCEVGVAASGEDMFCAVE